jgi:hypothetical protein
MLAAAGYLCCRDRIENGFLGVVEVRGEKSISWRCGAAREFPLPLTLDLGIAVDHFFSFSWDSLITVSWPKAPYERNDCRKTLQVQVLAGTSKCTQLARRSRSLLLPSMDIAAVKTLTGGAGCQRTHPWTVLIAVIDRNRPIRNSMVALGVWKSSGQLEVG